MNNVCKELLFYKNPDPVQVSCNHVHSKLNDIFITSSKKALNLCLVFSNLKYFYIHIYKKIFWRKN